MNENPALSKTSVSDSNSMESKIEIVGISKELSIHFIHVPDGYSISKLNLSDHKTEVLGRLNQFNRLKYLKKWKEENGNLVHLFTNVLKSKGWDFEKFPNPVAYAAYYCC